MFDFERLDVYQKAKAANVKVFRFIYSSPRLDDEIKKQWKRASLSVILNLAEGTGRTTSADKKHFFTIARGSVYECTALLDVVNSIGATDEATFKELYSLYEEISKMLLSLYRSA